MVLKSRGQLALGANAARRLMEIANTAETKNDGRIDVEEVKLVFFREGGSSDAYQEGIDRLVTEGLIAADVNGAFFQFTGEEALHLAIRQRSLDSFRRRTMQGARCLDPDRQESKPKTVPAIKHLSGPQKGIWNLSDPGDERILIGRAWGCDVDFPSDCRIVGERHLVLVLQPTGEWIFQAIDDHYVSIDGRRANHGQIVNFGDRFEIGEPGGPSFEFALAEWAHGGDETIED